MPGGKRRRFFTPVGTNPTFVQNMLLGLEMVDRVGQSFVKVHFYRMTTKYSNWLIDKMLIRRLRGLLEENSFSKTTGKDPMKTTMNSKEGTMMTKYLS